MNYKSSKGRTQKYINTPEAQRELEHLRSLYVIRGDTFAEVAMIARELFPKHPELARKIENRDTEEARNQLDELGSVYDLFGANMNEQTDIKDAQHQAVCANFILRRLNDLPRLVLPRSNRPAGSAGRYRIH